MQVKIYISATLRSFTGKRAEVIVEGTTLSEAIDALTDEYPEIKKGLFDEEEKLRSFVAVYLNEDDYTESQNWHLSLREGDEIYILPAIAGGAPEEELISKERRKEATLDDEEIERYSKHLMLADIGVKGQKALKASKVLIIGLGSLGSSVVQYLAAAGVGTIGLADSKEVSISDLQSQVIHTKRDIHRPKTASAKDKIKGINPKINAVVYSEEIGSDNIRDIIAEYDVVVDCTDNFKSRYLINDACVLLGKPVVFGAIYQLEGRVSVLNYKGGPCFRCMFPAPPPVGLFPTCSESGVVSPLPGIIGSRQAVETIKLLTGSGKVLSGKLLISDIWNNREHFVNSIKRDKCPICGLNPTITDIQEFDYEEFCGLKVNEDEIPVEGIELSELIRRIDEEDELTIIDVREPHERAIHRFPNAIAIPIGQLARRQKELNPDIDTIFICREGKRSILAINTLREAGYKGNMYNLIGGIEAAKGVIFSHEGAWL